MMTSKQLGVLYYNMITGMMYLSQKQNNATHELVFPSVILCEENGMIILVMKIVYKSNMSVRVINGSVV